MNVLAAFRAETLKLRRRPAVWILLGVLAAVVVLFGYALLYVIATQVPSGDLQGADAAGLLRGLRPAALPSQVLGMVAGFGGAIGLVLGALVFGAEYGWGTVATIAIQGPQRLALFTGRVLALGWVCVVLALTAFVGGVVGTALVALLAQGDTSAPPLGDTLAAFGAAALIIAVWAAIGLSLATLFRGTGWAIGLGLIYSLAVESVLGLLPLAGDLGDLVSRALIGNNVAALVASVSTGNASSFGSTTTVDIAGGQAVAVLCAYLVVALLIAVVAFLRRDLAR